MLVHINDAASNIIIENDERWGRMHVERLA